MLYPRLRGIRRQQRGDMEIAEKEFAEAIAIENRRYNVDLNGLRGIWWAEHLHRTGQTGLARELATRNREIWQRNSWQQDVARCRWMLGSTPPGANGGRLTATSTEPRPPSLAAT